MLFEKTTYLDDFPLNIRIMKVTEYPYHYHQDVEFVYVLKGEIWAKDVSSNYLLKEGDIFTFNGREVHGMSATDSENIIAVIQMSNRFFTQYFPSLPKGCFMTYVERDNHPQLDNLRKMLLPILLEYTKRSLNYKNTCVYQMIEVIRCLNQHFNLFAFEDKDIVSFKNNNPIIIERISRIINYIYANHSSRITLDDIAQQEHLSTFYLSHLIREYMGISFQELLCFARVEMSEIPLLQTDKRISTIAKDTGFSSTNYYEKFFRKWFGHSPEEHRHMFLPHILSDERPAIFEVLSDNQAIKIIKHCLSAVSDQEESNSILRQFHMRVEVQPDADPIANINTPLKVIITREDFNQIGEKLLGILCDLNYPNILLSLHQRDNEADSNLIINRLRFAGYEVSTFLENELIQIPSFGYDSIAAAIHLVQSFFSSDEKLFQYRLRDQGDSNTVLKGSMGCLTSGLIPKPAYYACRLLQNIRGTLKSCGKFHYVVQNKTSADSYTIVMLNYNDEIQHLCTRDTGIYETNDIINGFIDELTLDFSIPVTNGEYIVTKYTLSNKESIFSHMSQIGFPENIPISDGWMHLLHTQPQSQISLETAENGLNISASISGAGLNFITINKVACHTTQKAI